jgi:hypothetical protein
MNTSAVRPRINGTQISLHDETVRSRAAESAIGDPPSSISIGVCAEEKR